MLFVLQLTRTKLTEVIWDDYSFYFFKGNVSVIVVCRMYHIITNKLQSVLRSEARLVLRKLKFDPITDDLRDQLLWLPICQRIQYKLGVLVYKCLHGDASSKPCRYDFTSR